MSIQKQPTTTVLAEMPHLHAVLEWRPFIDPAADLGLHNSDSAGDSFFIVSYLSDKEDEEHRFTVLFHLMMVAKSALVPLAQLAVSVLDETSKEYFSREINSPWMSEIVVPVQTAMGKTQNPHIDITLSGGHLTGSIEELRTTLDWKDGPHNKPLKFEFAMKPRGPALPNLLTGVIPFTDGFDYEYALPAMDTSGQLTIRGKTYHLSGRSWLDREWGSFGPCKWTWMNIQLGKDQSNDFVSISLWDEQTNDAQPSSHVGGLRRFATILTADGSLTVTTVNIEELAHWTSPYSNRTYATRWKVSIPDGSKPNGKADLEVALLVDNQEIQSSIGANRIEGRANVTGKYEGKHVEGLSTVEQYDLFPLFAQ